MSTNDTFIVSKAGFKYLQIVLVLFVLFIFFHFPFFEFLTFIAIIFIVYIYRNPEREIPYFQKGSLLSPVDGKVSAVRSFDGGFEVVVESTLFNCSILRAPFLSNVSLYTHRNGARLSTDIRKATLINEKVNIAFSNGENQVIEIEHIVNNSIDGISIMVHPASALGQGKRYGVMTAGKTIIKFPLTCRLSIQVGSELKAGETLLGYIS